MSTRTRFHASILIAGLTLLCANPAVAVENETVVKPVNSVVTVADTVSFGLDTVEVFIIADPVTAVIEAPVEVSDPHESVVTIPEPVVLHDPEITAVVETLLTSEDAHDFVVEIAPPVESEDPHDFVVEVPEPTEMEDLHDFVVIIPEHEIMEDPHHAVLEILEPSE